LAQLKARLEREPLEDFSNLAVVEEAVASLDLITIAGSAPVDDPAVVAKVLGGLFGELAEFARSRSIDVGPPMTLTEELDGDVWRFRVALPVRDIAGVEAAAPVDVIHVAGGPALVLDYVGPYGDLPRMRDRLNAYALAHGHTRAGAIQHIHVNDPADTPAESLVTRLVFPLSGD
jgi:hypothetical protein